MNHKQKQWTESITREEKVAGGLLIYTVILLIGFTLYLGGWLV